MVKNTPLSVSFVAAWAILGGHVSLLSTAVGQQPALRPVGEKKLVARTAADAPAPEKAPADQGLIYKSHIVTEETVGHGVAIDVPLKNAKKLWLVVTDAGNGFGCDWADWVHPRVVTPQGEVLLTSLKWDSASTEWGKVQVGKNAGGSPLVVNGKPVADGIGVHANSVIEFTLPAGANQFLATGGLDAGGVNQKGGTSVQFQVWTTPPVMPKPSSGGGGGLAPDAALVALDVAAGLDAATFAAEPMLLSPSSMDIDARGRVWVAEIVNYRGHNGKRPEGDRILILEDLDMDGQADKQKVFYQGKDLISPHGVTVLDGSVIVAAGDKVLRLVDADRNDVAEKVEVLFSGIKGAQHDHGIHAFHFGPDGQFYFNFGNSGEQLRDAEGKPITDLAGNVIECKNKPYQEGLIFRCTEDFKQVETLAWNFRNNWECCVDSFGTIWQSDNDDDGNKSVRINHVLEFGNYGYRDELSGASWSKGDAKTDAEVQAAHWHQFDPGVVPNLCCTGAGSPTGILLYEGGLLPERFQHQIIHCDAGPNSVRAYLLKPQGAGHTAEMAEILHGARDRFFRPSDVCVAPDGSLFVADWYDPGVGGHGMGDLDRGRIYRVAPAAELVKYQSPTFPMERPEGIVQALVSPNEHARYLAWQAIKANPAAAQPALEKLWNSGRPHEKARAMWALGKLTASGKAAATAAMVEKEANLRIAGIRLLRQLLPAAELPAALAGMASDAAAEVRREVAIALRHTRGSDSAALWAKLALQHEPGDRWSLAALHIGAQLQWDACFSAWQAAVPGGLETAWDTPNVRDILWTCRSPLAAPWLVKLISQSKAPADEKLRFVRTLDYLPAEQREKALRDVLAEF